MLQTEQTEQQTISKEQTSPPEDIKKAATAWWEYVAKKTTMQPDTIGVDSEKLVPDRYGANGDTKPQSSKTVKVELTELDNSVNGQGSTATIEGIRQEDTVVHIAQIYPLGTEPPFRPKDRREAPFATDPSNNLPRLLKDEGITPDRFILAINTKGAGKLLRKTPPVDMLFFTSQDGQIHAFTIKGKLFKFKNPEIRPSTQGEIEVVTRSLKNATEHLAAH